MKLYTIVVILSLGALISCTGYGGNDRFYTEQDAPAKTCPPEGNAHSDRVKALNKLKNRAVLPAASDFDTTITLARILSRGDDTKRWSVNKAVRITGYVSDVKAGGAETCNCKTKDKSKRDTHIEIVLDPMHHDKAERLVVEVTPNIRKLMTAKGIDWTTQTLRDKLLGRWVRVEGWLFFDGEHDNASENTNPGSGKNWRATAWEVHPVTKLDVVNRPR